MNSLIFTVTQYNPKIDLTGKRICFTDTLSEAVGLAAYLNQFHEVFPDVIGMPHILYDEYRFGSMDDDETKARITSGRFEDVPCVIYHEDTAMGAIAQGKTPHVSQYPFQAPPHFGGPQLSYGPTPMQRPFTTHSMSMGQVPSQPTNHFRYSPFDTSVMAQAERAASHLNTVVHGSPGKVGLHQHLRKAKAELDAAVEALDAQARRTPPPTQAPMMEPHAYTYLVLPTTTVPQNGRDWIYRATAPLSEIRRAVANTIQHYGLDEASFMDYAPILLEVDVDVMVNVYRRPIT